MRAWYCPIALAGLLFLAACTFAGRQETVPRMVVATSGSETTSLAVNQILMVALHGNPTTGFCWSIAQLPDFLEQVGSEEYKQDSAPSNKVGVGGTTTWNFRAIAPGSGILRFVYQRSWEQNVPPEKTAEYSLTVSP
jgi:inhibitor of cysteine peptidase